ncbi:hypothetical protein HY632_03605 [Candidatus Uhrbacteria bacterium]|nr:hypothetical protein [Candidatus Uhrbacteria bacterium]
MPKKRKNKLRKAEEILVDARRGGRGLHPLGARRVRILSARGRFALQAIESSETELESLVRLHWGTAAADVIQGARAAKGISPGSIEQFSVYAQRAGASLEMVGTSAEELGELRRMYDRRDVARTIAAARTSPYGMDPITERSIEEQLRCAGASLEMVGSSAAEIRRLRRNRALYELRVRIDGRELPVKRVHQEIQDIATYLNALDVTLTELGCSEQQLRMHFSGEVRCHLAITSEVRQAGGHVLASGERFRFRGGIRCARRLRNARTQDFWEPCGDHQNPEFEYAVMAQGVEFLVYEAYRTVMNQWIVDAVADAGGTAQCGLRFFQRCPSDIPDPLPSRTDFLLIDASMIEMLG